MGITGLLPLLRPVTKDVHISELKGLTVGIDTYCWLHKGIYSCSAELCQGLPTDKFIKYCVERVHLLLSHGVKPYLVFDGGYLPAKAGKEEERRVKRESNLQRAMQLTREGNASGAHQFFCKAADVTPFMAHQVIQVIKRIPGVQYVVAPYEADAQLGFLARNGHVDAVITEDSDIMLFGCSRVVFKLERDGTGQEVDLSEVFSRRNDELDMRGMNEDDLMTLCALSGCDYLPSVHGMGLKKAYRMVSRHKQLPKILRAVKFDSGGAFPRGYEADFQRALLTFRHQRAFDPVSRSVVHMTPLPESLPAALLAPAGKDESGTALADRAAALAFLGPPVAQERGCAVADGDVDPITGEAFSEMGGGEGADDGSAKAAAPESALSEGAAAALAAWRGNPTPAPGRSAAAKKKQLSAQGNNLTKYWGAPVSSSKKSRAGGATGGRGDGDGGMAADRSFEFATPDRPSCGVTAFSGGEGGTAQTAAAGRPDADLPAQRFDPDKASPASLPSCVSPGSFYTGVSESPSSPAATPGHATSDHVGATRDGKENQAPLSPLDDGPSEEAGGLTATSKFFGGGGGGGGVGGGGDGGAGGKRLPVRRQSGLRRRFRPPHAASRLAAQAAVSKDSTLRRSGYGSSGGGGRSGGDQANQDDDDHGHDSSGPDPWGAEYAYPRPDDASRETAGGDQGRRPAGAGAGSSGPDDAPAAPSSGGCRRRLKRRRTLGVGSLGPGGMIRGLEGTARRGLGGPGRRSKSLGAAPGDASSDVSTAAAYDNNGSDVNDDAGGRTGDGYVSNLFERFAAGVHARSPVRNGSGGRDDDDHDQLEPRGTTAAVAATASSGGGDEATAADTEHQLAVPDSEASEGEEETGGGDDDGVGGAHNASCLSPSPPPSSCINSRGYRVCPAGQQASPVDGAAGGGIFDGYRTGFVDDHGIPATAPPRELCRAANGSKRSKKSGGAGDRKAMLLRENAATRGGGGVTAAAGRSKGRVGGGGAGVIGVTASHIFEQFAYSP